MFILWGKILLRRLLLLVKIMNTRFKTIASILIFESLISCGGGSSNYSLLPIIEKKPIEVIELLEINNKVNKVFEKSTRLGSFSGSLNSYQNGVEQGTHTDIVPMFMVTSENKVVLPDAKERIAQFVAGYRSSHGAIPERMFIADDIFWGGYTLPVPLDSEIQFSYVNLKGLIAAWREITPSTKLIIAGAPGVMMNPHSTKYAREIGNSVDEVAYFTYQSLDIGGDANIYFEGDAMKNIVNLPECKDQAVTGHFIIDGIECASLLVPGKVGIIYQAFLNRDEANNPLILAGRTAQLISNWDDMKKVGNFLRSRNRLSFVVPFGFYWSESQRATEPGLIGGISFMNENTLEKLRESLLFN